MSQVTVLLALQVIPIVLIVVVVQVVRASAVLQVIHPSLYHVLGVLRFFLFLLLESLARILYFGFNFVYFAVVLVLLLLSPLFKQLLPLLSLLGVVLWVHSLARLHLQRNIQEVPWIILLLVFRSLHMLVLRGVVLLPWNSLRRLFIESCIWFETFGPWQSRRLVLLNKLLLELLLFLHEFLHHFRQLVNLLVFVGVHMVHLTHAFMQRKPCAFNGF